MFRFAHFFIDRPIFATVLSVLLTIAGAIAQRSLPISEYPEIAPPTVSITATYPGASAEVVAATVATPIEQEVNGVDDMLYITSQSTGDGRVTINVVFKAGVDVDQAQVLVQNRVSQAEARLPQDVRALGIQVRKASPDFLMVINMISPDGSRDAQYISNYASLYVKDVLTRVDGVGDVQVFGARDFSMRIWLDPAEVDALMEARPAGNVANATQQVSSALASLPGLAAHLDAHGEALAEKLRASHRRVRSASGATLRGLGVRVETPPDVLGLYVFVPVPKGL